MASHLLLLLGHVWVDSHHHHLIWLLLLLLIQKDLILWAILSVKVFLKHFHGDILGKIVQVDLVTIICLDGCDVLLGWLSWYLLLEVMVWFLEELLMALIDRLTVVDLDVVGLVDYTAGVWVVGVYSMGNHVVIRCLVHHHIIVLLRLLWRSWVAELAWLGHLRTEHLHLAHIWLIIIVV